MCMPTEEFLLTEEARRAEVEVRAAEFAVSLHEDELEAAGRELTTARERLATAIAAAEDVRKRRMALEERNAARRRHPSHAF